MSKLRIAIVTDSASNIPDEFVNELGIKVVPNYLHWDDQVFRDGIDISPDEVYRRLRESESVPHSSAPSVGDFMDTYSQMMGKVDGIVSIHLPAELSAVIKSARIAAESIQDQVQVKVVEAGTAAMGAGFVTLYAARIANEGAGIGAVVRAAREIRPYVGVMATVDTLEYLHRGGRVGRIPTLIGTALRINPIVYLKDNRVGVKAIPRTRSNAIRIILQELEKQVGEQEVSIAVMYGDAVAEASQLRDLVQSRFQCRELLTCSFTPVMGAHTGPSVLGLAYCPVNLRDWKRDSHSSE